MTNHPIHLHGHAYHSDPGWYTQPPGTQAYEYTGELTEPRRSFDPGGASMPRRAAPAGEVEVKVRKPVRHVQE